MLLTAGDPNAHNPLQFIVKGQCVVLFRVPDATATNVVFCLSNHDNSDQIKITMNADSINALRTSTQEVYIDAKNHSGLTAIHGAYYWVSLDSKNQQLLVGVGEARLETMRYSYIFPTKTPDVRKQNKAFLESMDHMDFDHSVLSPLRMLRDPIIKTGVPMLVKDKNSLTMDDVAGTTYLPAANLPQVSQQMYNCVGGSMFVLDTADFPDFTEAIEHSIATPGCWCYKMLQKKASEFNPDKPNLNETYLRITMGCNDGESPGIPYVMEIWPPRHYSPIHNHAGANAVIRVLHGSIQVSLYPFLSDTAESSLPFAVKNFSQSDVTWISPYLNQVHKLTNVNSSTTCITIQCYLYGNDDDGHYDYFDYIGSKGGLKHYEPDSDADFLEFKSKMKVEWAKTRSSVAAHRTRNTNQRQGVGAMMFM